MDVKSQGISQNIFKELTVTDSCVQFSVWAPAAEQVRLLLYFDGANANAYRTEPMRSLGNGRWTATLEPYLFGKYYTFQARIAGVWQTPAPGYFACAVGVNGVRAAIIDWEKTNPEGWAEDDDLPALCPTDCVIYELHHRDFSMSADSGISHRGQYLALTEAGTHTVHGLKSGLDHLNELGITHVHLLPSFDFASIDESHPEREQYNWGYDPLNYNVPEGSYATSPFHPEVRIREFKQMVLALHRAGLRVVLDVVYNHTYTVEGSNFQRLAPDYFFRKTPAGTWADGSGCGNETASERPVMRLFMLESLKFWVREYHVDGFRFDSMGLHDLDTMQLIERELHRLKPGLLLYGEGWSLRPAQLPAAQCALKCNMRYLPGVAAFADEMRDGLRGSWTNTDRGGMLAGIAGSEESVKFGIVGCIHHSQIDYRSVNYSDWAWAQSPEQVINYVSCHDGLCLTDCLLRILPRCTTAERLSVYKLAETILFTSQGIPLLFAGDEFYRSKHGDANSYKSGDGVNAIPWTNKYIYYDLYSYIRRLIAFRKYHAAFRLRDAESVRRRLRFVDSGRAAVISYWLDDYFICFNANPEGCRIRLPKTPFDVYCRSGEIDVTPIGKSSGGRVCVAPFSALILKKRFLL